MKKIDLYNAKKKQLIESTQKVGRILKSLKMSKEIDVCSQFLKKLHQDKFKVVVMGEFKVGKSTFINALLGGGDVLPAQATPCTAIINEVKYSDEKYAIIHFKHPLPSPLPKLPANLKAYIHKFGNKPIDPIKIPINKLNQFVVIDDEAENQKDGIAQTPFSKAEIYWDLPICKAGIEIIDSPGLNENMSRTDVTMNYLPQADAVLFVLDCTRPCSASEQNSIEDLWFEGHEYTIFACNKINMVKENERSDVKKRMDKMLLTKTKLKDKGVFCINAEAAKDGRFEKDKEKFEQSGVADLENSLYDFLIKKRGTIKLLYPARQLLKVANNVLKTGIPNEQQMLSLSIQEIEDRLKKEQPNLDRLQQQKDQLVIGLDNEISQISWKTEQQLETRFKEIIDKLEGWVNGIECQKSISMNPFKVKRSTKEYCEELTEKLQNKLTYEQRKWQEDSLQRFLNARLKELSDKYEFGISQILVEIEQVKFRLSGVEDKASSNALERAAALVAGFLGGGVGGAAIGGVSGFSKEFALSIASQIAVGFVLGSLLGFTNPITIVALIVSWIAGMGFALEKIEEKVKKEVAKQVVNQIRTEKGNSIKKAVELIRKRLKEGTVTLSAIIDKEIQSVQEMVESIKQEKILGEQKVQERKKKLEEYKSEIQGIISNTETFIKYMEREDIEFEQVQNEDQNETNDVEDDFQDNDSDGASEQPVIEVKDDTEKQEIEIDATQKNVNIDGVTYVQIFGVKHENNGCHGQIYMGDDASCVCAKCGEKHSALCWKKNGEDSNDIFLRSLEEKQGDDAITEIAEIASRAIHVSSDIRWSKRFYDNLEELLK